MAPYVLIIAAVNEELALLDEVVINARYFQIGRRKMVSGFLYDVPICLLTTGPGQVNVAQAVTAVIENDRPALVIQTGCAGTFGQAGLAIGDVGIASEEIDAHLGLEPRGTGTLPDPLPFSVGSYGGKQITNRYAMNARMVHAAEAIINQGVLKSAARIVRGPFLTVSTITTTDRQARIYFEAFQPCMESMEGAGAAHVALHYEIPLLEIRSASNLVGNRQRERWQLPLAFERSSLAVLSLLQGDILNCIDR